MIEIQTHPDFANRVLNHPEVRPFVGDLGVGTIDVAPIMDNPNYLILGGEHGIFFLVKLFDGCWETHTAVLPSGRGEWAVAFAEAGSRHMFTATDCVEILTRVPRGHVAAASLSHAMGFRHQFTTPPECLFLGRKVEVAVLSLTIQDWVQRAPGLEERGTAFHAWLNSKIQGEPHEEDRDHNRIVGSTLDMFAAGQINKGLIWYNRWAFAARHKTISLVGTDPVQVRFDAGVLTLRDGQISVEPWH